MAHVPPVVPVPHRTSLFVGALVVAVLASPLAAVETFALGLAGMVTAVLGGRGRLDGVAGVAFVVAGGLVAGALPYLLVGFLDYR
jgi:energy-converting hydrogenase Eha subunit C